MQSPLLLLLAALLPVPQAQDASPRFGRTVAIDEHGPPAREHAVFVADAARDRAVLYAGSGYRPYGTPLGDAWAFDFATEEWSPLELVGDAPPPAGSRRAASLDI